MKVKAISLPYVFQVMYVLSFTRPRYQVSVYRTIVPLVIITDSTNKQQRESQQKNRLGTVIDKLLGRLNALFSKLKSVDYRLGILMISK